jgi:tetratricopeptide (TPR) repeat protein
MRNIFLIFWISLFSLHLFANANLIEREIKSHNFDKAKILLEKNPDENIDLWRELGFVYKENDELKKSIFCYEKILNFDSDDYDARLALARLYFETGELATSQKYFQRILDNDETDVEAYLGLARIQKAKKNFLKSIEYYELALKYLPENVPLIFEMTKVYLYSDQLDKALLSYKKILKIDDTWSEAWRGIGKIFWWRNQPFVAMECYKKAIVLDPENSEINRDFQNIKKSLDWNFTSTYSFQKETEDESTIKSYNQKYKLSKRITDNLLLNATSFWQYADKNEDNLITKRYYDSSYLKSDFFVLENLKLDFTIGGSLTDSTLTVIGGGFGFNHHFKDIKITNYLNFGNEYFYYWKKVRRNYFKDKIQFDYKKFSFETNYQIGKVEKNYILNKSRMAENTFLDYNFSLKYKIDKFPNISVGAVYRFMDYAYDSSLYYSPIDRKLYGLTSSLLYPYRKIYLYLDGSVNRDNNEVYETNFDAEIGVSIKKISLSLSYSSFKNKYYENNGLSLTLGGSF